MVKDIELIEQKAFELSNATGIDLDTLHKFIRTVIDVDLDTFNKTFLRHGRNMWMYVTKMEITNDNRTYTIHGNYFSYSFNEEFGDYNYLFRRNYQLVLPIDRLSLECDIMLTGKDFMDDITAIDLKFIDYDKLYAEMVSYDDYAIEQPIAEPDEVIYHGPTDDESNDDEQTTDITIE